MRKGILLTACLVLVAGTALGAGSIISSFRSPATYVMGMGYYSPYLYHADYSGRRICVSTTTGSLVRTVSAPAGTLGCDFDGTYYWVAGYSPAYLYQLTSTGSVLRSWSVPSGASPYGITFDGTYVWYSSARSGNMIYQYTSVGSLIKSMSGPGSFNGGLDWANGYIWVGDWPSTNAGVFRITTTGSTVESYRPVPSGGRSAGVAWDGGYLWYSNYTNYYVYKIDTVLTSILPSSLGKIKSIYR
jgi:streptogramin lyase